MKEEVFFISAEIQYHTCIQEDMDNSRKQKICVQNIWVSLHLGNYSKENLLEGLLEFEGPSYCRMGSHHEFFHSLFFLIVLSHCSFECSVLGAAIALWASHYICCDHFWYGWVCTITFLAAPILVWSLLDLFHFCSYLLSQDGLLSVCISEYLPVFCE